MLYYLGNVHFENRHKRKKGASMEYDFYRVWLPYIYLYVMGGVFFFLSLGIVTRAKALNLKIVRHRKWLVVLVLGLLWYMFLHWLVTYSAMNI